METPNSQIRPKDDFCRKVFLSGVFLVMMTQLPGLAPSTLNAQHLQRRPFLEPADTLDKARFWTLAGAGTLLYTGSSIGLYDAWYKDYETTTFHFFNDWAEWENMDKVGHLFTAYTESALSFKGALWTGMKRRPAMWTAAGIGMLLQGTVEIMDAFSAKWGFSVHDIAFNTMGVGLFAGQELLWQDQRIIMKVSNTPPEYSSEPVFSATGTHSSSPVERARSLYGVSFAETFLKDYNGQTLWFSVNPAAFIGAKPRLPQWLNIAVGYGAENMFGGYGNSWSDDTGNTFSLPSPQYDRYRQYYLSFDADLTRIPTRSRLLRSLFSALNWIKIPAPAIELNSKGEVRFHPFFW